MTENEKLLQQAEGQANLRRLLLVINAASYVVWIGSRSLTALGSSSLDPGLLSTVQMAAWPVWLVSLVGLLWAMARLRKRRDIAGLVDDERTTGLSARSFQVGYWVLLVGAAAVYTASFFITVDVKLVAPALVALGVAAPSLTYAALYRS